MRPPGASAVDHHVAWHDAECGSYAADLPLWERLASERGGAVLDLGAGAGRVALHLARRGHELVAVDNDARLLAALAERAAAEGLAVEAVNADCRRLALAESRRFALAIAPMQLLHLLGGRPGRTAALRAVAGHLEPGGRLAAAVLDPGEDLPAAPPASPPPPDVLEIGGWVHSSFPLAVRADDRGIEITRLRQLVAPDGTLSEERHTLALDRLPPTVLEREAGAAGLALTAQVPITETAEHVASLAMIWERSGDR